MLVVCADFNAQNGGGVTALMTAAHRCNYFASFAYAPIAGSQLAEILLNNIKAILGDINPNDSFTPIQTFLIHALNKRFALYAQALGN